MGNNPLRFNDPRGEIANLAAAGIGAGVGAVIGGATAIVAAGIHLASQRPQVAVGVDRTIGFVQDPSGTLREFDQSLARSVDRVNTAVEGVGDVLEFLLTPGPIESRGYPSAPNASPTTRAYGKP